MDSLIHSLRDVTIRSISVSEMNNNVYLLTSKSTGAQLLIDAADDLPAIQQLLQDSAADTAATPKLARIATTHQHWDHVRALPELVAVSGGATTSAGADDADALPVPVDVRLGHGDVERFDGFEITAVHLRGHTQARSLSCTRIRTDLPTFSVETRCFREASATHRTILHASLLC